MDRCVRSRDSRCTECGRKDVDINGTPLCKHCHALRKLGSVNLFGRPATLVGLLPQSYFDVLEQLKKEYRCTGCRSVFFGETVTCETCMEHLYCSFTCLQAHKRKHTPVCLHILIAKGTSDWCQRASPNNLFSIFLRAKSLDDTGCADYAELRYNDWWHSSVCGRRVLQQKSIDTFTKNAANLIGRSPSLDNKKHCCYKSSGTEKFKNSENKPVPVSLEIKQKEDICVNSVIETIDNNLVSKTENIDVDNLMETVGDNIMKETENVVEDSVTGTLGNNLMQETDEANHHFDTFRDVKMLIANGMFARWFYDNGLTFGEGWWRYMPNKRSKKPQLKLEFKPFAAALQGVADPAFGLTFCDFYDDSDSEEGHQEGEGASSSLKSSGVHTEPNNPTSDISPELSDGACLENKLQAQDTTHHITLVSESPQQLQLLTGKNTTKIKHNGITNTQKKHKVVDSCMFCHCLGYNLKTCARCGFGKYCSKSCQINGFSTHKKACKKVREMKLALSMIPSIVTEMMERKYGTGEIFFSCDFVPADPFSMFLWGVRHVMVKITDVIPTLGGLFLITVEDITSKQEKLALHYSLPYSMFHAPYFGTQMPLTSCLQPGNYILLISAHREPFFIDDVLVCDDEHCFFILMK